MQNVKKKDVDKLPLPKKMKIFLQEAGDDSEQEKTAKNETDDKSVASCLLQ